MYNDDFIDLDKPVDRSIAERVAKTLNQTLDQAEQYIKQYEKPVWFIGYRLTLGIDLSTPFARIER